MRSGFTRKMRAKIITVDPRSRRIEAMLKDGAVVQVALWEIPTVFRWPSEGEFWSINQIEGHWHLGDRLDIGDERKSVAEMNAGDMRLEAPGAIEIDAETVEINATRVTLNGSPSWISGSGSPEGAVTADPGSLYSRTDGGAGTTLYVKESGTGDTGWVAK